MPFAATALAALVAASAPAQPDPLSAPPSPAPPAPTTPARIGVVFIVAPELDLRTTDLFVAVERTLTRETVLDLADLDLFTHLASRAVSRRCAGDADCYLGQARASGQRLDYLLTISVVPLDADLAVALRLLRTADGPPEVQAVTATLDPSQPVHRALGELLPRVFPPALWQAPARLRITSRPEGAEARVGAQLCKTPCELGRLPAGRYAIDLTEEGFRPWRGARALRAGRLTEVAVALEPSDDGAWYASPWLWGSAAAVVVGAVVTGVLVGSQGSDPDRVCLWHDPAACN